MYKYLLIVSIALWTCDISIAKQDSGKENLQVVENKDSISNKNANREENLNAFSKVNDKKLLLYIGTYTDTKSKGIYLAKFDVNSGMISTPELAASINNPSFQCISADKKQLWSVNEAAKGMGQIVGFKINQKDGGLRKLATYSSEGSAPCYIAYDNVGNSVLAANYSSGNFIRLAVNKDGIAKGVMSNHQHEGSGPNKDRQRSPHAHSVSIDLNGKYAYSCDLGADKIYVYDLAKDGLSVHTTIKAAPGSGPRHIAFQPGNKAMSVVHELNNTITTYLPDKNGCFTILKSVISALPSSYTGKSKCAEIHYSPNGHFLYASNRGHNSIVICKVNQKTMELKVVGWMKEAINWPRNFIIDPSGKFLIVANKNGDNITVYKINQKTGLLKYTGYEAEVSEPVCLTFLSLNKD